MWEEDSAQDSMGMDIDVPATHDALPPVPSSPLADEDVMADEPIVTEDELPSLAMGAEKSGSFASNDSDMFVSDYQPTPTGKEPDYSCPDDKFCSGYQPTPTGAMPDSAPQFCESYEPTPTGAMPDFDDMPASQKDVPPAANNRSSAAPMETIYDDSSSEFRSGAPASSSQLMRLKSHGGGVSSGSLQASPELAAMERSYVANNSNSQLDSSSNNVSMVQEHDKSADVSMDLTSSQERAKKKVKKTPSLNRGFSPLTTDANKVFYSQLLCSSRTMPDQDTGESQQDETTEDESSDPNSKKS